MNSHYDFQKLSFLIVLIALVALPSFSQPKGINYQAVVRDNSGIELANTSVKFRFNIFSGSTSGNLEYQETQNAITNQYGLAILVIGQGSKTGGSANTLTEINWNAATFISVELSLNGGTNYSPMGSSQYWTVPYTFISGNVTGGNANTLAKWNAANSGLAPSLISDNGSLLVVNGSVNVNGIITASGAKFNTLNKNGAVVTVDGSGNLGVGILPVLSLKGSAASTILGTYPNLTVTTPIVTLPASWNLAGNAGTSSSNFIGTTDSQPLSFYTNNTQRMSILSTGNIGIGISNPVYLLHVNGSTPSIAIDETGSSNANLIFRRGGVDKWYLLQNYQTPTDNIAFYDASSGTKVFQINPGGNIGIGTVTPLNKLDVSAGVAIGAYGGVNTAPTNGLIVSGNVGIGTSSPSYELDVRSSGGTRINVDGGLGTDVWTYYGQNGVFTGAMGIRNGGVMTFFNGGDRMVINNAGNVGIGTTSPVYRLDVVGSSQFTSSATNSVYAINNNAGNGSGFGSGQVIAGLSGSAGTGATQFQAGVYGYQIGGGANSAGVVGAYSSAVWGALGFSNASSARYGVYCNGNGAYTGSWSAVSDKRLKKDIKPMGDILEKVLLLKPSTYYFKSDEYSHMSLSAIKQNGLIAQEVEEIFPEIVSSSNSKSNDKTGEKNENNTNNSNSILSIDYIKLIPVLIKAIQEQQSQIEAMKAEIKILNKK